MHSLPCFVVRHRFAKLWESGREAALNLHPRTAVAVFGLGLAMPAGAAVYTFDNPTTPGVALGGSMIWNGMGGGHLYNESTGDDDYVIFDEPVHLMDFQMNAQPWENYPMLVSGLIDIEALDSGGAVVWSDTVDLTGRTDWSDWLTVSVHADNVKQLRFLAPAAAPHFNGFWPSVDNISVGEMTLVPEPASYTLAGVAACMLLRRRRR